VWSSGPCRSSSSQISTSLSWHLLEQDERPWKSPLSARILGERWNLDFTLSCKSKNYIYVALCRHCNDKAFYFGQTTTPLHIRFNGHRGCFKINNSKFNDSAISHHIYTKHLENFHSKLLKLKIGIVQSCSAVLINRF
jgi:hypothetical protein